MGSVIQVLSDDATNPKVLWASEYTAFGQLAYAKGDLDFGGLYTGKDIDPDTGLTYHWNRWRSEDGSRFISEDPAQDGSNWYGYANNNPINFSDPTGLGAENQGKGSYNGSTFTNDDSDSKGSVESKDGHSGPAAQAPAVGTPVPGQTESPKAGLPESNPVANPSLTPIGAPNEGKAERSPASRDFGEGKQADPKNPGGSDSTVHALVDEFYTEFNKNYSKAYNDFNNYGDALASADRSKFAQNKFLFDAGVTDALGTQYKALFDALQDLEAINVDGLALMAAIEPRITRGMTLTSADVKNLAASIVEGIGYQYAISAFAGGVGAKSPAGVSGRLSSRISGILGRIKSLFGPAVSAKSSLTFSTKVSIQKQIRHIKGTAPAEKSYLNSVEDAQAVLDKFNAGEYNLISENLAQNNVTIAVKGVTGTYVNVGNPNGRPDISLPTNKFMIQSTTAPKVVPVNPNKKGIL